MNTYSERQWVQQSRIAEYLQNGWQETGRTMTNGAGQRLIEIGKPIATRSSKKQSTESEETESEE